MMKQMITNTCNLGNRFSQPQISKRSYLNHHHRSPLRVKVCCISSIEELHHAVKHGANAVGLVSQMPSGPGIISEEMIASLAKHVPPGVSSFLLTASTDPLKIVQQQKLTRVNTIQICDALSSLADYHVLRKELPGISLVQVIHVEDENSIEEALSVKDFIDGILLDSGKPKSPNKELGGTGRVHDWKFSKKIVDAMRSHSKPVFLAGGLQPNNVRAAIEFVRPFGVDLCSGVRTDGKLDEEKLKAFMQQVRAFM